MSTMRLTYRTIAWTAMLACALWLSSGVIFAAETSEESESGGPNVAPRLTEVGSVASFPMPWGSRGWFPDVRVLGLDTHSVYRGRERWAPGRWGLTEWWGAAHFGLVPGVVLGLTNNAAAAGPPSDEAITRPDVRWKPRRNREAMVVFGRDVVLKGGETAEAVVVIGGSAKVYGNVRDAVVAIGGDVTVDGRVGETVVALLGNVELGTNATAGRDVVAVIGNVTIGSRAEVGGDAVAFGGTLDIADDARIGGKLQEVDFGRRGLPSLIWLQTWVKQCVLKLRPLAPQVGWVWVVWGMFLLLYLLVAIAFPRPVAACVDELTHRPATTFAIGLLTKLLLPFVLFLLLVTGIGVFVIPFIWIALVLAGIVGKAALLEYFGKQLGRGTGLRVLEKPVLAFIAGAIIITLLYMVPVLGVIVLGLTGMWALGAAILALFSGLRREVPAQPAWPGAQGASSPPQPQVSVQQTGVTGPDVPGAAAGPAQAAQAASAGVTPPQMIVPEALQYPRAGFWARLGAAFLDVVLVGVISGIAGAGAFGWLIALAYFTGMWTWRGTTVGGVLLNLKVVRLDGRPVTFAVAFVRALAAAFSVIVFFLGFLWIAWDREKQAWHDKIVGTVVVRLPRSQPLLSI